MFLPSATSVRLSGGRPVYTGRVGRAAFDEWIGTAAGRTAVSATIPRIRFPSFGRERRARGRLWRDLARAARDRSVVSAIQRQLDGFLSHLPDLVFGDGLPRAVVDLRRLVVVPSVMLNATAFRGLDDAVRREAAIAGVPGGDRVRHFLLFTIIADTVAAVARAAPSLHAPLVAGDGWVIVGMNRGFVWRSALDDGPEWPGHCYVLELTRQPITRSIRKQIAGRIQEFESSLPSLSRIERNAILVRARPAARSAS